MLLLPQGLAENSFHKTSGETLFTSPAGWNRKEFLTKYKSQRKQKMLPENYRTFSRDEISIKGHSSMATYFLESHI